MNSVSGIRKKESNIGVLSVGAKPCFRRISICIFLSLFFFACSDYVGQIDDQIDEYNAHEKARSTSMFLIDETFVNPEDIFEGSFKDSRDKQVYKTVTIGSQTWMAENLNYKVSGSYCYNDDSSNCDKYGRLYTWAAAMDSVGKFGSNAKGCGYGKICAPSYPVRGVCPEGWHFPSYGEWETLLYAVDQGRFMVSDVKLKSKNGWKNNRGGDDEYGFSVLPAGEKIGNGKYYHKEMNAYFWLSTEFSNDFADFFYIGISDGASLNADEKCYAYSIRCVKDVADERPIKSSSSEKVKSSSSSKITSSSSVEKKGSSSSVKSSSSAIVYGSLKDSRDGKTYKTVKIGTQTWMAENLNYDTQNAFCYNDSAKYCEKYGRLYTWAAAMDSVGKFGANGKGCGYGVSCSPKYPVRGICPEGWHLPSSEFKTLIEAMGGESSAGKVLKATNSWNHDADVLDEYGFSIIPAGHMYYDGYNKDEEIPIDFPHNFSGLGESATFWSSGESQAKEAGIYYLDYEHDYMSSTVDLKNNGFSIRCVED